MHVMCLLMAISVVGTAALFVALALFLRAIDSELETIGGPATRVLAPLNHLAKICPRVRALQAETIGGPATRFLAPVNYLAKIRLGVRAIERQTDALGPQVGRLNERLTAIRD